ncbi:hypothetical protein AGDE_13879 [Angomonas deanei]|uniref:UTP23 sensor motif region domain-containing protein n=1 Tax=Angomonas deanei TaxID=59799 RepID=A0A7G2CJK7_9TRYP|nr:hypothetical protein AGDE_13879 [Angomonas deanei]CAD2219237.1 hypothetical protein, conserved [Angomonas deanei]|eukprot:EPY21674.1 hypothetical protein AGDE_13879 [Angomonas deanei]
MKRRVSRSHTNKKNIRILSTANRLTNNNLKHIHLLCDASFLRMFLQNSGSNSHKDVFGSLKQLALETFSVIQDNSHNTHNNSTVHVNFYCVPQTVEKITTKNSSEVKTVQDKKNNNNAYHIGNLFSGFHRIDLDSLEHNHHKNNNVPLKELNEVNCLSYFIRHYQNKPLPSSEQNSHNNQFYFVATQNHDLRRQLDTSAAVVRWTTKPLALWIEHLGSCYHYNSEGHPSGGHKQESRLSTMDMAFVKHLDSKNEKKEGVLLKKMNIKPKHAKREAVQESKKAIPHNSTVQKSVDVVKKKLKKKHVKGPNPLSMKKKKKQLVFRAE